MSIDTQRLHLQEKIRSHYNCYYSTPLKKLVQLSIPCKYLCNITWCGYILYSTIPHQWVPRSFPVVYCYKFCYNKHPYIIMFLFQENQYFQNWEFLELQFCLEGPRKLRVSIQSMKSPSRVRGSKSDMQAKAIHDCGLGHSRKEFQQESHHSLMG